MSFLKNVGEVIVTTRDILRGVNTTIWGGAEGAQKVSAIVKTGASGADIVIGTSHALEDIACNDVVCATLDIIACASTAAGMVLGNLDATKKYTVVTGSITVGCRSVRWYCKEYGTVWGCTVAAGEGIKAAATYGANKFFISKSSLK